MHTNHTPAAGRRQVTGPHNMARHRTQNTRSRPCTGFWGGAWLGEVDRLRSGLTAAVSKLVSLGRVRERQLGLPPGGHRAARPSLTTSRRLAGGGVGRGENIPEAQHEHLRHVRDGNDAAALIRAEQHEHEVQHEAERDDRRDHTDGVGDDGDPGCTEVGGTVFLRWLAAQRWGTPGAARQQRPDRRAVPGGDSPERAGERVTVGEPVRYQPCFGSGEPLPSFRAAAGSIGASEEPDTAPREIDEESPVEEPVGPLA